MEQKSNSSKKVTIIIIVLVIVLAAVITISESRGGPLPTWGELFEMAGFTEPEEMTPTNALTVHFIDVGQGDSIFLQTPEGDAMLIDGGEKGNENTIISYIRKYGEDTLDYVVATHPHSDHIGSLDETIAAFTVKNVLMPRLSKENTPTTAAYRSLLTSIKNSGAKTIAAKAGMTFSFGEAQCTVLSPKAQSEDLNNMSVVLRLDYGNKSFLFTGDAESPIEKEIMAGDMADYVNVDVLKLGHHGSRTSTGSKFLSAVSPDFCVISCGVGNDYGHPHKETMEKLSKIDTTILRTDEMGSIRIFTDGVTMSWESDHE